MSLVTADNLEKTYQVGDISVKAICGGNFTEFREKQNENKLELRVRYHF